MGMGETSELPRNIPFNPTYRRPTKIIKEIRQNARRKKRKFNGLMLIKISNGNSSPLRLLAIIFTRPFVIVLRSRFDFPYPHMPIPAARGDEVVRPPTRRCPSDRSDGESRGRRSSSSRVGGVGGSCGGGLGEGCGAGGRTCGGVRGGGEGEEGG